MSTRKIKDAKDLSTNELIYFKGHAKATYMSNGITVEDAINSIQTGSGGGIGSETDPVFTASPAASITNEKIDEWNDLADSKTDKITVSNQTATSKSISPNILYVWGTMSSLSITLATPADSTIYNEYMFQFTSGSTATTLSLPSTVKIAGDVTIESNKTYLVSILNNVAIIIGV